MPRMSSRFAKSDPINAAWTIRSSFLTSAITLCVGFSEVAAALEDLQDDEFHCVSKRDVQEGAEGWTKSMSN
jgi:hypothetical protein